MITRKKKIVAKSREDEDSDVYTITFAKSKYEDQKKKPLSLVSIHPSVALNHMQIQETDVDQHLW